MQRPICRRCAGLPAGYAKKPGAASLAVLAAAWVASMSGQSLAQPVTIAGAEAVQPAAVASERPFQARYVLDCATNLCTFSTPAQAANKRLAVRFVSCFLKAEAATEFDFGDFSAIVPGQKTLFGQWLVPAFRNTDASYFFNQKTEVFIGPSREGAIRLKVKGGKANEAICSVAGTLQTLQ